MKFVIEQFGALHGPFDSDIEASEYARAHLSPDWRLRTIHTVPKQAISHKDPVQA